MLKAEIKDELRIRREILRKLLPRMAAMRICRAGGQDGGLDACDQSAPTGTAATQAGAAPFPQEGLLKCARCGQGFDLTTEDPLLAGLCRECGDQERES